MKTPTWLNREWYPFDSHFYDTPAGKMHYVDEGEGDPVVFVHGNPSWSFEFRGLIRELSGEFRCIAPDHIGFGLSDKPRDWSYLPAEHAANFEAFLESLGLDKITMVVGDWGGPIGLSHAISCPEKIKALVITNTWLWSVRRDLYYQAFSKFTGGMIGRYLIRKRNFFARDIVRAVYGDTRKLTPEIHAHYLEPLAKPEERKGNWIFPKQIVGSSDWIDGLWSRTDVLQDKKILIAWGMKDMAFRKKELKRWMSAFPGAKIVRYPGAGHFLAEEKPSELTVEIRKLSGE